MKYKFFLDETGDHGLSFVDDAYPIFLLLGLLISEEEYAKVSESINVFKRQFFSSEHVVLHSRDIRKCQNEFQILLDENVKKDFYSKLNKVLSDADYSIFFTGVDKKEYIARYGRPADDPYSISLSSVLEKLVTHTDSGDCDGVSVLIEKRGRREDARLESHYKKIVMTSGTGSVSADRFRSWITDFGFASKRDNSIGLQLADLCAYPVARSILFPNVRNLSYEALKAKILSDDTRMLP